MWLNFQRRIRRVFGECCNYLLDMITHIKTKKKIKPTLKNGESKYLTRTAPEDPVLPGLFVFQGMRGSGKTYAAMMMCRHFEKMGYIQRTFLLRTRRTPFMPTSNTQAERRVHRNRSIREGPGSGGTESEI